MNFLRILKASLLALFTIFLNDNKRFVLTIFGIPNSNRIPEILRKAKEGGVDGIIVTGTTMKDSRAALVLCKKFKSSYPSLYCTAGVHPHNAKGVDQKAFASQMTALLRVCHVHHNHYSFFIV
tara:strand:- start:3540 stop:3908 length:369 start_codon:yes stop_codon:yes gene_type:complete